MIVVTGGAGFIGSNIVKGLNKKGRSDIIVVDDLSDGRKFRNLVDCQYADYFDKDDFIAQLPSLGKIDAIFHEGACSDTTEWDGRFIMKNNFEYTKKLFHYCLENDTAFIYASSAATYGGNQVFREEPQFEAPLNVYGYSKLFFDQYARPYLAQQTCQIVGLRYFNVYGPGEDHKGGMSSVAYHFNQQLKTSDTVKLFEGTDGYGDGEQLRDFVYIGDVVDVNLWLLEHPEVRGIFNVGTGRSQSFNDVARAVIDWHERGEIEYIDFPEKLKGCYQSFTQADISRLRAAGYSQEFKTVEEGVRAYMDHHT